MAIADAKNLRVRTEFVDDLTTISTRHRGMRGWRIGSDRSDLGHTLRYSLKNRASLRANRRSVGCVFNIATGENLVLVRYNRRADGEMAIRAVRMPTHVSSGGLELLQQARRNRRALSHTSPHSGYQ